MSEESLDELTAKISQLYDRMSELWKRYWAAEGQGADTTAIREEMETIRTKIDLLQIRQRWLQPRSRRFSGRSGSSVRMPTLPNLRAGRSGGGRGQRPIIINRSLTSEVKNSNWVPLPKSFPSGWMRPIREESIPAKRRRARADREASEPLSPSSDSSGQKEKIAQKESLLRCWEKFAREHEGELKAWSPEQMAQEFRLFLAHLSEAERAEISVEGEATLPAQPEGAPPIPFPDTKAGEQPQPEAKQPTSAPEPSSTPDQGPTPTFGTPLTESLGGSYPLPAPTTGNSLYPDPLLDPMATDPLRNPIDPLGSPLGPRLGVQPYSPLDPAAQDVDPSGPAGPPT